MSRRVLSSLKRILHRSIPTPSLQHALRPSTSFGSRSVTTFFASNHLVDASSHDVSQKDRIIAAKTEDLFAVLERDNAEPSDVWSHYTDLLQTMGLFSPPLVVHQRVLRKCVPSSGERRVATANEYHADAPQPFEGRLRAVMENMLSAGLTPELEDYEFILRHYASCGHHLGAEEVMKEMRMQSVERRVKTYGLCLQALAHRLALPCAPEARPHLVDSITQMCRELMIEMQDRHIPFSSVNVDLAIRILKEAADDEGFDQLIKFAYGIDLAYPDCPPLEAQDGTLAPTHPLSTSALNTIVDTLGRAGRISKMVQAFEVLTQPLFQVSSPSSAFDDEEDETIYPTSSSAPQYRPPHAEPNTRTYNLLVMHAARARHTVLARHYIVQARHQEEIESQNVRGPLYYGPAGPSLSSPHVSVNRGTLVPLFHVINQEKDVALLRFLRHFTKRLIKSKRHHLRLMTEWLPPQSAEQPAENVDHNFLDVSPSAVEFELPDGETSTNPADIAAFTPSSPLPRPAPPPVPSALDVDLDAPIYAPMLPPKRFSRELHIAILRRDIAELEEFLPRVGAARDRAITRRKEALGRRVWNSKDVYLAKDDARVDVDRAKWKKIVWFGERPPEAEETQSVKDFVQAHNPRYSSRPKQKGR